MSTLSEKIMVMYWKLQTTISTMTMLPDFIITVRLSSDFYI
jgi:hypothetical protein